MTCNCIGGNPCPCQARRIPAVTPQEWDHLYRLERLVERMEAENKRLRELLDRSSAASQQSTEEK